MTLEEKSRLSCYREISVLNKEHRIFLVQHTLTGRIYVKKTLKVYDLSVLMALKDNPVPHIPRIYELFQDNEDLILIEEYINGSSLQDLLDNYGLPGEDLSVNYVLQLCRILYELHHYDPPIIHRDIKPSNIIVSEDGTLTLIDLDAAKYAKDEQTRDTRLLGTQGYAAPEQYGFGSSGPETDIYALGVLLNVLLTGKFPRDQIYGGHLGDVIETCTKMDPEERYPDTDALARALLDQERSLQEKPASRYDTKEIPVSPSEKVIFQKPASGWKKYLLPGFRTGKVWKMLLAVLIYTLLIAVSLNWTQDDASPAKLFINRLVCLGMFLSAALFSGNYLNIQDKLHLDRLKSPRMRILAVIFCDGAIIVIWLIILVILSGIFLP